MFTNVIKFVPIESSVYIWLFSVTCGDEWKDKVYIPSNIDIEHQQSEQISVTAQDGDVESQH